MNMQQMMAAMGGGGLAGAFNKIDAIGQKFDEIIQLLAANQQQLAELNRRMERVETCLTLLSSQPEAAKKVA